MDSPNLKKLKKQFPEAEIKTNEVFIINDQTFVTSAFLEDYWNVSDRQIRNYTQSGMPASPYTIEGRGGIKIFNLNACIAWKNGNIDKKQSQKTKGTLPPVEGEEDVQAVQAAFLNKQKFEAEVEEQLAKTELAQIKVKEAKGELVAAENLDISMAEQAMIYITNYKNDKKILPTLLEDKKASEMIKILDEHFSRRVEDLEKFINKVFESDETIYDIMEVAKKQIMKGIDPERIVDRIKSVKK